MQKFIEKKFNLPELKGISSKNIEEHLKLYAGYVKNANLILSMIEMYGKVDDEAGKYSVSEITRRFAFEFNGMRNHEYYFANLENGAKNLAEDSKLKKQIIEDFGSFENWLTRFKTVAMTRGVGWAILFYDKQSGQLLNQWVDEHHLGQLNGLQWILGIDMWEHAYVYDYPTSEKKKYIEAFFENLNWETIENNFKKAQ